MGYIRHQGILCTGSDNSGIGGKHDTDLAREKAIELGLPCSEIVHGTINSCTSFLIAPDGSKEGWSESDAQEERRKEWIKWARKSGHWMDWVCVSFGGDNAHIALIEDHNERENSNA